VIVEQGRQSIGAVLAGVLVVADADAGALQQADDRGDDLRAGQPGASELAFDRAPDHRQGRREGRHALELGLVAHLAPTAVIAVLLASARVAPRRLEVSARVAADP